MNAYRLASVLMAKDFPDFYEDKKVSELLPQKKISKSEANLTMYQIFLKWFKCHIHVTIKREKQCKFNFSLNFTQYTMKKKSIHFSLHQNKIIDGWLVYHITLFSNTSSTAIIVSFVS